MELEEAMAYFDGQLQGLGGRFQREVQRTVSVLTQHPEIGSPLTKRIRKFRVRTFRYNVIYVPEGDEIVIIAVAHQKKWPRYWRRRISPEP